MLKLPDASSLQKSNERTPATARVADSGAVSPPKSMGLKRKTYSFLDNYVTHEELLGIAYSEGRPSFECEILNQATMLADGIAIVKATVNFDYVENGKLYLRSASAIGDAGYVTDENGKKIKNCNAMIFPHFIRMAHTRAVNRALRLVLGIGKCSKEELGENDTELK